MIDQQDLGNSILSNSSLDDNELHLKNTVSDCVIQHAALAYAKQYICDVIKENSVASEARHVMLVGDSGCGKTTLLDIIKSENRATEKGFGLGIGSNQPVLALSLPSTVTSRSMAMSILRAMGDTSHRTGNCQELTEVVIHYIKQSDVKVIFLDEFQHLLALGRAGIHGANQHLLAARNWIKSIINATNVTFVLMGTPDSVALINSERQLERRFPHFLELRPFAMPSNQDTSFAEFADNLLKLVVEETDFFIRAESFCENLDDAVRLYVATQGVPSGIKDFVDHASRIAYRRKSGVITMSDFAGAFTVLKMPRLKFAAARARLEECRSLTDAMEGRSLNVFTMAQGELFPIALQMAA